MNQEDPFVEELGDEGRSSDRSDTEGSLRDFLVNDDTAPVETRLPSQGSDLPIHRTTTLDGSVSIFKTSDRVLASEGKQAGHAGGSDGRTVPLAEGPTRGAGMSLSEMHVGDLSSYQGTTVTERSDPGSNPRLAGGEETKVEGYGDPGRKGALATHSTTRKATTPTPLDERTTVGGKADQLPKRSTHGGPHPRSSEGQTQGEVDMDWESEEVGERNLPSTQQQWEEEAARLALFSHEAVKQLEDALHYARAVREEWTRHLWTGGHGTTAEKRTEVMCELSTRGDLWGLLFLKAEEQELMKLSPSDIAEGRLANWEGDWRNFLNSKKTTFSKPDVLAILQGATDLQDSLEPTLSSWMGSDAWMGFSQRHRELVTGLMSGGAVSARTAKLFPRDRAGAIMRWYARWTAGLTAMQTHMEALDSAKNHLLRFAAEYPGPEIEIARFEGRVPADGPPVTQDETRSGFNHTGLSGLPSTRSGFNHTSMTAHEPMTHQSDSQMAGHSSQRRVGPEPQRLGTSAVARGLPEEQLPYGMREAGMSREDIRDRAGEGGYFYRQLPPGNHQTVNTLDPQLVKYQEGQKSETGNDLGSLGSQQEKGNASVSSRGSSLDDLSGFTGMDRTDIEFEVRTYVTEKLGIQGNATPLAIGTLVKHIPKLGLTTKRGHEPSVAASFSRNTKLMTPFADEDDGFISVPEWMRLLCQVGDDNAWSIPTRIRFLARTGGLAKDVYNNVRQRVIDFMRDPASSWLPTYEPTRDEGDHRYWLFTWLDVELKMIQEFHTELHQEVIDAGITKLMKQPKYQWTSTHDPLNRDFYKVALLYQDLNNWLIERSSDMVNSPMYVFRLIREWLKEQCGPAGEVAVVLIDKAVARLSTDPEASLPSFHMLTEHELAEVKKRGKANPTSNTYRLILENLKKKAVNQELDYTANSLTLASQLMNPTASRTSLTTTALGARKKERKANSVTATDVSSLTLNTTLSSTSRPRSELCPSCSMFHGQLEKECPFWDPAKRIFKTQNFWNYRTVRKIEADGSSTVNEFWLKKLKQHGFRGMGITEVADQEKILKDLKALAAKAPKASIEERKKWMQQNQRYINLAKKEEQRSSSQSSSASQDSKSKPPSKSSKTKSSKRKKKEKVEELESSSDDLASGEDYESDFSDDFE